MKQRQFGGHSAIRKGKALSWLAGCICAALTHAAAATTSADEPDPFALSPEQLFGATVMSATRSAEKLWDAPAAIYVLSSEDIKRSGATSIPEALRMVPGVQVARTHAGGWAISVRGFNAELANKLLVLIDGREVYDPLFSGVYWDIQDTMLEDVERIEVIRGPGASLWGANAVNGVINIITKSATETQGNLTSVTVGNQDHAIVGERYGGTFGEDGHYRVYGKTTNRDSEPATFGGNANDAQTARRGGFRADWGGQDGGDSFTLQGDAYDNHDGQLRSVPNFTAPDYSSVVDEHIFAQGGNILGRWNHTLPSGALLTTQSYIDHTARNQALADDARTTFDLDSQMTLPQDGRHAVIIGGRYRFSHDALTQTGNILTSTDPVRNDQLVSGFVQDKITLDPDNWYLTLGTKIEHNDYTGFELQPNARLQFHPDAQQMVWASVSRAVRTPSRLENDIEAIQAVGGGGAVSLDTLPNSGLKSEELVAYELGYRRHLTPAADLDLAAFYNDYQNMVTYAFGGLIAGTDPTRTVFALVPNNSGKAHSYGGETTLSWRARPDLNFSGSYSLLELSFDAPPGSLPEVPVGQSPQQQFDMRAQWDIRPDLSFDTMLYYVNSLPDFAVRPYWRMDTRLGWKITDGLEFNLVGQNLFDNRHQEFNDPAAVNAVEIQRAVYGQVLWHF